MGRSEREHPRELTARARVADRKSTRLNSSHLVISYAVFCLKKKKIHDTIRALTEHMKQISKMADIEIEGINYPAPSLIPHDPKCPTSQLIAPESHYWN